MIKPQTCPICRKPVSSLKAAAAENRFFPFCSQRCQQIDLLRWSKGQYRIVENLSPEQLAEELEQRGQLDLDGG